VARLADMDLNHVQASICFPQFPRFCGQEFTEAKDKQLGLLCIKAYNDWMVEEWCGADPKRLLPLCIVPLWDADLAAAEVRRNAARGAHAVCFSEIPAILGLPSIHSGFWEPFFQICQETATTVCMHIGSSSKMQNTSNDAPPAVEIALSCNNAMNSLMDYLFSGVLVRYPRLKLAYSESQIGWIPYFLERADTVWDQHRAWNGLGDSIPEPPSSYFRRQVFGCFFRDFFGMKSVDSIGVDNVTFEVDYPHTDSTWPDSQKLAGEMLEGVSDDVAYRVLRGNAMRMLSLDMT
jgi:predicted TIM-barrel fold metal-dependent hydrolase